MPSSSPSPAAPTCCSGSPASTSPASTSPTPPALERVRGLLRSLGRIVAVSVAWIGLVYLLTDDYALRHVFLAALRQSGRRAHNHFWFIEALRLRLAVPVRPDRPCPGSTGWSGAIPFALPLGLAAVGLIARYQLVPGVHLRTPAVVFWLFALGWAAAKADHRLAPAAARDRRRGRHRAGLLRRPASARRSSSPAWSLLIWAPTLPSLRAVNRIAGAAGRRSLYIYLTHWQVYPHLNQLSGLLALLVSLVVGIAVGELCPPRAAAAPQADGQRHWVTGGTGRAGCLVTVGGRRPQEEPMIQRYEYQSEFARKHFDEGFARGFTRGFARGFARGMTTAVLTILRSRDIKLPADVEMRVAACTDLDLLEGWLVRAVAADRLDDLFQGPEQPARSRATAETPATDALP